MRTLRLRPRADKAERRHRAFYRRSVDQIASGGAVSDRDETHARARFAHRAPTHHRNEAAQPLARDPPQAPDHV